MITYEEIQDLGIEYIDVKKDLACFGLGSVVETFGITPVRALIAATASAADCAAASALA